MLLFLLFSTLILAEEFDFDLYSQANAEINAPFLKNPCTTDEFKDKDFCQTTLGISERIENIISLLTVKEKINLMGSSTSSVPSVGLGPYNWWSEATHGISHVRNDAVTPKETNFALPVTTAGAFNRSLWTATGKQIGIEARSFMNAGNAYSTYWAPVINLIRDPRWGRNIETPGEDPYLTGQYAINFVKGFEHHPDDETHLMASACCKHYVANSMESSTVDGTRWNRMNFDASVTQQDLVDSYMAPFQDCVEQGQVSGLMCSYNSVNGIPSCANNWLLEEVARKQWQFDGYITSDCDADSNVYSTHHYTDTPEEAVKAVLEAGTDVDCGGFVQKHAQSALDKGVITEGLLDERLRYQFRIRMRLGHFDPDGPLQKIPPSAVCTDEALALSRDGTVQGSVLLKNVNKTLPWSSDIDLDTLNIAVIGPNSNLSYTIAKYYGGDKTCKGKFWNAVDAVAQYANVTTMLGVDNVTSSDVSKVPDAVKMAKNADGVVLVVGQDGSIEHEGHDRVEIGLSDAQKTLVEEVARAAKSPVVVVVLTGGAVDVQFMLDNPNVGAIIHAGQPSVTVLGVGDLIFGKNVPAGRMIQTIYPESYVNEVSIFDMNMRPGPSAWPAPGCTKTPCKNGTNPGRTHRFYTGKPVVPFGYGLSYSTFEYKVVNAKESLKLDHVRDFISKHKENKKEFLTKVDEPFVNYIVNVTNTGDVAADDVVLGFLTPPGAGENGVPLQSLFGFDRVHLKPQETKTVYLAAAKNDFAFTNLKGEFRTIPGEYKIKFGVESTKKHGMGYAEHSFVAY